MSSGSGERLLKRTCKNWKNGGRVLCVWDVLNKKRIYKKKSEKNNTGWWLKPLLKDIVQGLEDTWFNFQIGEPWNNKLNLGYVG